MARISLFLSIVPFARQALAQSGPLGTCTLDLVNGGFDPVTQKPRPIYRLHLQPLGPNTSSFGVDVLPDNHGVVFSAPGKPPFHFSIPPGITFLEVVQEICGKIPPLAQPESHAARAQSAPAPGSEVIATADLNGDGLPDYVSVSDFQNARVYLGAADGTSKQVAQYPVGPRAAGALLVDINKDGKPDLLVTNFGNVSSNTPGGNLYVLLGNGDGTFQNPQSVNAGSAPSSLAVADFNSDGKPDVAVNNVEGNSGVSVLFGNGDGTFRAPVSYSVPANGNLIAADLNGDGNADIAVAARVGGDVTVLLGSPSGTLQVQPVISLGRGTVTYLTAFDANGDGKVDLIENNQDLSGVTLLPGKGDGTFQPPLTYVNGASSNSLAVVPMSDGAALITVDGNTGEVVFQLLDGVGRVNAPLMNPVGGRPTGVAVADLNGDKIDDIVVADNPNVSVFTYNPNSGAAAPKVYNFPAAAVAIADITGDGKPDVVAAGQGSVSILPGNGDGTFGNAATTPVGSLLNSVAVADFNGDGKPDVAVTDVGDDETPSTGVSVLINSGDGALRAPVRYAVGPQRSYALISADFNGDGKPDLAVATGDFVHYNSPGQLGILIGKGDGTFAPPSLLSLGSPATTPTSLAVADVNGDGKIDIVAITEDVPNGQWYVNVLLSNGDGTFRQLTPLAAGFGASAVAVADLNGDGNLDLVVSQCCGEDTESSYWLGNGDGTFQAKQYFSSGSSTSAVALGHFDSTGAPGLAMVNQGRPSSLVVAADAFSPLLSGAGAPGALTNVSVGSTQPILARDSIATGYGSHLATGAAQPGSGTPPTTLNGTAVTIRDSAGIDTPAPLFYVSPAQVNYEIPGSVALGPATITVKSGDGAQSSGAVTIVDVEPGLYTLNTAGLVAANILYVAPDGTQTYADVYAVDKAGNIVAAPVNLSSGSTYLLLYGTGLRHAAASQISVSIGGVQTPVLYAGPQGAFIGLDQVNVQLPSSLAGKGDVSIVLTAAGKQTNAAHVTVQ